jgi:tetratricopeptide (TPR) repeat protein
MIDDIFPEFYHDYANGQLLIAQNNYNDAHGFLLKSFQKLRNEKNCSLWKRIYINCATALVQTLDLLGKYEEENEIFQELLTNFQNESYLGDYAIFLHRRKKDFNNAEKYFEKALELYPFQFTVHLKYAGFLRYIRQDLVLAEKHYKLAVDINSNSETLGTYASFLHSINKVDEAEALYQKSVDIDKTHINNLCNYGLLLSENRKQYHLAENYYRYILFILFWNINF